MLTTSLASLTDRDLLEETARAATRARQTTADLIALLAELDSRKLYRGEGYSSLFAYCTQALHLSEPAAYSRITAARASRRYREILTMLRAGDLTLTTVGLLAPHLTDDNHESLFVAARRKSKRDVEHLVACLHPQPDITSSVRQLPAIEAPANAVHLPASASVPTRPSIGTSSPPVVRSTSINRPCVAPLAPERFLMRVTITSDTHRKLERARDLLRHTIPNGDPAAIVDRALSVLVEQLERAKAATVSRPRRHMEAPHTRTRSRHIPAAVKRSVWTRDVGRCAFVGTDGRCAETGCLEFHHVVPYAAGGSTDADNLQLRCRAHNAHEAELFFGPDTLTRAATGSR